MVGKCQRWACVVRGVELREEAQRAFILLGRVVRYEYGWEGGEGNKSHPPKSTARTQACPIGSSWITHDRVCGFHPHDISAMWRHVQGACARRCCCCVIVVVL